MSARTLTAALALGLAAGPALAQNMCAARDTMVGQLTTRYGESPQGSGLNGSTRMVEVWASADTGTWTILLTDTDGTSCIVAAGKDWLGAPVEISTAGSPA
jgi:hypothetical protein